MSLPPRRAVALLLLSALWAACGWGDGGKSGGGGAGNDPAAALEAWARARPGADVFVTVRFPGVTADNAVIAYLQEHALKPYAVFAHPDGTLRVVRSQPSAASLELVGDAREQTATDLTLILCAQQDRAWAMIDPDTATDAGPLKAVLSHVRRLEKALPAVTLGRPIVYAVQAIGTVEDVRGALEDARATVAVAPAPAEPAGRGAEAGVAPEPAPPDTAATDLAPEVAAMSRAQVVAAIQDLARRGLQRCQDQFGSGGPQG